MLDMRLANGSVYFTYLVPTRGLLGFRNDFLTATRGTGVINTLFDSYRPYAGDLGKGSCGSLLATEAGVTNPFGLANAEERGTLFVGAGVEVYAGMIVGKHVRDIDLDVNVWYCTVESLKNNAKKTWPRSGKVVWCWSRRTWPDAVWISRMLD